MRTDLAASVRDRLRHLARPGTDEFAAILTRYGLERLLYRLSVSEYRNRFVLKGALLFAVWAQTTFRPTRDLDLLGFVSPDIPHLRNAFRELCRIEVPADGLVFRADSVLARRIREEQEYQGIRVNLVALLKRIRIPLQIDVGIGDQVVPPPEEISFPTLLDFPSPRLRAYSRYTVIAEKYQTIVERGLTSSRMRDYYDIWVLSRQFEFNADILIEALEATFRRRRSAMPVKLPPGVSDSFADDAEKLEQWRAFLRRSLPTERELSLKTIVAEIACFIGPASSKTVTGATWKPGRGWIRDG